MTKIGRSPPCVKIKAMSKASRLVTDAILGEDAVTVVVSGKAYFIEPPTIMRLVKAAKYLDSVEGGATIQDVLGVMRSLEDACKALSIFIQGDENLTDELAKGTPSEIVDGLKLACSLISISDFRELSTLARSVARMIASPRP